MPVGEDAAVRVAREVAAEPVELRLGDPLAVERVQPPGAEVVGVVRPVEPEVRAEAGRSGRLVVVVARNGPRAIAEPPPSGVVAPPELRQRAVPANGAAEHQHRAGLALDERGGPLVAGPRAVGDLAGRQHGDRLRRLVGRGSDDGAHGDRRDGQHDDEAHGHTLARG